LILENRSLGHVYLSLFLALCLRVDFCAPVAPRFAGAYAFEAGESGDLAGAADFADSTGGLAAGLASTISLAI
jgi:hypothetical protein